MWRVGEEIRVIRARVRAWHKSAIFLACLFCLFSPVNSSAIAARHEPQAGDIEIRATVPLQPGFAAALARHSKVVLTKNGLYPGEKATIRVQLSATGNERLRHRLRLEVLAAHGRERLTASGNSDANGGAEWSIALPKTWLGSYVLRVIDLEYPGQPIWLVHEPTLRVLEWPVPLPPMLVAWQGDKKALGSDFSLSSLTEQSKTFFLKPDHVFTDKHIALYRAEMRSGP